VRLNADIEQAPGYPFLRVAEARRAALEHGLDVVDLSLGQPTDPAPQAVRDALAHGAATLALCEYPTTAGLAQLRHAISGWVARRYGVELEADQEILPTLGAKEPIALLARLFGIGAPPRLHVSATTLFARMIAPGVAEAKAG